MKNWKIFTAFLSLLFLTSCTGSKQVIIPLSTKAEIEDTYTIIWNGVSNAYIYQSGAWVRAESYDYVFDVVQKRGNRQWKSVKSLHRLHPGYDGKAGDRDQTMYFELAFNGLKGDQVQSALHSSLGTGTGITDREYREQVIEISVPNASSFMPFNKYKITQHYNYEEGQLTETVELYKEKEGTITPFMKNEEKAYIYTRSKLTAAPTVYQ
jgi:hypothetical protein